MIVESIELTNFMCYAGENRFDFTEGMNVIIGDNGYGKSKLYDAFYWTMYDQCFDTNEKQWKGTRQIGETLFSDKAVHESADGLIRVIVKITFKDIDKDEQYIIERSLTAQKRGKSLSVDLESVEVVSRRTIAGMVARVIEWPDEIERFKKKVMPDNVRPYMWFQGEQVESIIDFGEIGSLTQAINVLSNITRFDGIAEIADVWEKSASDQYHKKVKALSSDKAQSDKFENDRERIIERIERLKDDIGICKENLGIAEEKSEQLINQQEIAAQIRELDAERRSIEKQLIEVKAEEEQARIGLNTNLFRRRWVLKGTDSFIQKYNEKYIEYQNAKIFKRAEVQARLKAEKRVLTELQTRLPINVPEPVYVEKMIDEEHCLVCNRAAPKDSDAWNSIKQLLTRNHKEMAALDSEIDTMHDFESDFTKLSKTGYSLEHSIHTIEEDISNTLQRLIRLEKRRKDLSSQHEQLNSTYDNFVAETALTSDKARNLLNELQEHQRNQSRFQANLTRAEMELEQKKKELQRVDEELGKLVKNGLPPWLKDKKNLLSDFKELAHATRHRVFKRLVQQLEDEANKHYRNMMQGNLGAQGVIKLVESTKGNYMPRLTDGEGNLLMQLNTGNIILIKLATIMAIISARQGSRDTDLYTLITDAPMSVFGEDYTIGFCKTVSRVYRQSIIMSKEFYKNESLRRQLLNDEEITLGKVYMITPSILEAVRNNRNSLSTSIKALN